MRLYVKEVTRVEMKVLVHMSLLGPNLFITFHMQSQLNYLFKIAKDYYINVSYFKTIQF